MQALGMFSARSLRLSFLALSVLTLILSGCQAHRPKTADAKPGRKTLAEYNQDKVNAILKTAFSQMGNPYRYGGASPETGFDCSGFVGWVYSQYGVSLPRSSRDMLSAGVPIEAEDLRPGDLVFFNYGYSHVGIYTGGDKFIHSPRTGKRIEEVKLSSKGRGDRFVGARRVIDNQGVTAISNNLKEDWIKQSRHQTTLALNEAASVRHTGAVVKSARSAPAKGEPKSVLHKVKAGDTLSGLAARYGVGAAQIAAANGLTNRHKLKLGQKLAIPTKAAATAQPAAKKAEPTSAKTTSSTGAKSAPAAKPAASTVVHKVVAGDNLVTLAKRYGLTSADIVAANGLTDRNKLQLGQKLVIPAKATVVASASQTKAADKGKSSKGKSSSTKKRSAAKKKP
ncbi:MAG: LysM peptidoglycan-binding domain-containing protein [Deltaproteobacteria bacterium]|jgi:LysM repeat protein|nr:LysM peptidoglycan-binding domain-containing protein [Deltaproteobacteria bacterium]